MTTRSTREKLIAKIFACTRCGYCCQGETTVSLDDEDQQRMVRAIDLSRDEIVKLYWRVSGNVVQMKVVDGHCIFYDPEKGCTVHAGRPWRCGQWPLHPSILRDRANFETIRASCPGINRDLAYSEFCDILRTLFDLDQKLIV